MPTALRKLFGRGTRDDRSRGGAFALRVMYALLQTPPGCRQYKLITRVLLRGACDLAIVVRRGGYGAKGRIAIRAGRGHRCDPRLLAEALAARSSPVAGLKTDRPLWVAEADDPFRPQASFLRKFDLSWCLVLPCPDSESPPHGAGAPHSLFLLLGGRQDRSLQHPIVQEIVLGWSLYRVMLSSGQVGLEAAIAAVAEPGASPEYASAMTDPPVETPPSTTASSETMGMLSHELRAPLTAVKNSVDLLLAGDCGPLNPRQEHFLGVTRRNTDRLDRLITDMLDLSRAEAGQLPLYQEMVDLGSLLREALDPFLATIAERDLKLDLSAVPEYFQAQVDGGKVVQMFQNVVGNAVKYVGGGGRVRIALGQSVSDAPSGALWLADRFFLPLHVFSLLVDNDGRGMDTVTLERIAAPFMRAAEADARRVPGAGLGLYITRGLAEAHGGEVQLSSSPAAGTRVRIVLPRDPASQRVLTAARRLLGDSEGRQRRYLFALDLRFPRPSLSPPELDELRRDMAAFLEDLAAGGRTAEGRVAGGQTFPKAICVEPADGLWVGRLGTPRQVAAAWQRTLARPGSSLSLRDSRWQVLRGPITGAERSRRPLQSGEQAAISAVDTALHIEPRRDRGSRTPEAGAWIRL